MPPHLHKLLTHLRYFYLSNRFFLALAVVCLLSVAGFWKIFFFYLAVLALIGVLTAVVYDAYRLYIAARHVSATRSTPKVLSLGDEMRVRVRVSYGGRQPVRAELVDELPADLQIRDHRIPFHLAPGR